MARRLLLGALGLTLTCVGLLVLLVTVQSWFYVKSTAHVERVQMHGNRPNVTFHYRFTADGKTHKGQRFHPVWPIASVSWLSPEQKQMYDSERGGNLDVWYDPNNPDSCVLNIDTPFATLMPSVFGVMLLLWVFVGEPLMQGEDEILPEVE